MGLDCSHGAWHGAYSAFMRWREKIAQVAGLPPLMLMEGFYSPINPKSPYELPTLYYGPDTHKGEYLKSIDSGLPIKWDALKPDPLHFLLWHSDCDGEIETEFCNPIADSLEKLIPLLPDEEAGGHIGNWRVKTQTFVDGLRAAAAAGEPLDFH
jgi:hypothetical protein